MKVASSVLIAKKLNTARRVSFRSAQIWMAGVNTIPACQKLDWPVPKVICSQLNDAKPIFDSTNPNISFRRALFFPPGKDEKPKLIWVIVTNIKHSYGQREKLFDAKTYLGVFEPEEHSFNRNNIQCRDLDRGDKMNLNIYCREDCGRLEPNAAVKSFTRAGICGTSWRGPLLVMRHQESEEKCDGKNFYGLEECLEIIDRFHDMDARDIRWTADYMSYAYLGDDNDDKVTLGSFIACNIDKQRSGAKYRDGAVDGDDSVFSGQSSQISVLIGIPLMVRKAGYGPTDIVSSQPPLQNLELELLQRDINLTQVGSPYSPETQARMAEMVKRLGRVALWACQGEVDKADGGFGTTNFDWASNEPGSVFVARADGLPFPAQHAEALCEYVKDYVEPKIQQAILGLHNGDEVTTRMEVLALITADSFSEFYDKYTAARIEKDPTFAFVPNPYTWKKDTLVKWESAAKSMYEQQVRKGWYEKKDSERTSPHDKGRVFMI